MLAGDPHREALWSFQRSAGNTPNLSSGVTSLRQAAVSGVSDPVIEIDQAILGDDLHIDDSLLGPAFAKFRAISRGRVCVDQARIGEAKALIGSADLTTDIGMQDFLKSCKKAGIEAKSWRQMVAEATAGLPDAAADGLKILLSRPEIRQSNFDPVTLFGEGKLPSRITIKPFSGHNGALLQQTGPPIRPVAYRGRLIRFEGVGWPDGWLVLDLRLEKQP